jgi:hypothetical protein
MPQPLSFRTIQLTDGFTLNITGALSLEYFTMGGGTITGPGNVTVTNTATISGGTMRGSGTTTIAAAATLNVIDMAVTPQTLADTRTLVNHGDVNWNYDFQIASTATIENRKNLTLYIPELTINAATSIQNFDTLYLRSGHYRITGAVTLNSTVVIGDPEDYWTPTTVTIDGSLTTQNLRFTAGTINGEGTHTITNTFDWYAGTLAGTGTTTIAPTGRFVLAGTDNLMDTPRILQDRTLLVHGTREYGSNRNGILSQSGPGPMYASNGLFDNAGIVPATTGTAAPFVASIVAGELYQAMYGGAFGGTWVTNTDEAAIFRILEGHTWSQLEQVATAYNARYTLPAPDESGQRILSNDLNTELSEVADHQARAAALLMGDRPRADAAALHYALNPDLFGFFNIDTTLLFRVLGRNTRESIDNVIVAWNTVYEGQPALSSQIESKLTGTALIDSGAINAVRAEAMAYVDAGTLYDLASGPNRAFEVGRFLRANADRMELILEEYRGRYAAPTGLTGLDHFFQTLALPAWSQIERDVLNFTLDGRNIDALAAALHQAMAGVGTNKQLVWQTLDGLYADERAMVAHVYRTRYTESLRDAIDGDFDNTFLLNKDYDKTIALLDHGGLTIAQQLYYAMYGLGTDIASVHRALDRMRTMSLSLEQIQEIDAEYQNLAGETLAVAFGGGSAGNWIGDLGSRDYLLAQQALRGAPATLIEEVDRLLERVDFDRYNGVGLTAGDIARVLSGALADSVNSHGTNLDRARARLVELKDSFANGNATEAQVRAQLAVIQQDLDGYTRAKDEGVDFFANALTAATAVGIGIFSGGSLTPVAFLVYSAIGGAANLVPRIVLEGQSYDIGSLPTDLFIGALTTGTSPFTAVRMGQVPGFVDNVLRGAVEGGINGGSLGFLQGAFSTAARESTWESGFQIGLIRVGEAGATSALIGAPTGAAIGGLARAWQMGRAFLRGIRNDPYASRGVSESLVGALRETGDPFTSESLIQQLRLTTQTPTTIAILQAIDNGTLQVLMDIELARRGLCNSANVISIHPMLLNEQTALGI